MFFEDATPKSAKRDLDTINVLQVIIFSRYSNNVVLFSIYFSKIEQSYYESCVLKSKRGRELLLIMKLTIYLNMTLFDKIIRVFQDIREELRLGREQRKQELSLLQQIASSLNLIESQSAGSGSNSSFTSPYKFNPAHYTHTPTSYSPSHSPSPFFPSTSNAFDPPSTFDHYETLSEDPNLVKSYYGDE